MHTVIRSYILVPGIRQEFIKRVQERLVPLLNHVPGFRAFTLMEAGDNDVIFISTFHTLADAKASARITQEWHTHHLNTFIQAYSRVAAGEVRVQQSWDCREADLLVGSRSHPLSLWVRAEDSAQFGLL